MFKKPILLLALCLAAICTVSTSYGQKIDLDDDGKLEVETGDMHDVILIARLPGERNIIAVTIASSEDKHLFDSLDVNQQHEFLRANFVASEPFLLHDVIEIEIDAKGGDDFVAIWDLYIPSTIIGGDGNDFILGSLASDTIYGDRKYDREFRAGRDTINGSTGNDKIYGGYENDTIDGGKGDDEIYDPGGINSISGSNGHDLIYGGEDRDDISGGEGNDLIFGGDGHDDISGDEGDDRIYGEDGNDNLQGNSGEDEVYGGDGNDSISGGYDGHRDVLVGGEGETDLFYSEFVERTRFLTYTYRVVYTNYRWEDGRLVYDIEQRWEPVYLWVTTVVERDYVVDFELNLDLTIQLPAE